MGGGRDCGWYPKTNSLSISSLRLGAENYELRRELIDLESELIGARLDNVYLDKELAGRYIMIKVLLDNVYLDKELAGRYIMIKEGPGW